MIEGYYITSEKEQIKSGLYDVLIIGDTSEIITKEILPSLNVKKSFEFKTTYSDFSTNDLLMVEFYVNGNRFYLAEKLKNMKTKKINYKP